MQRERSRSPLPRLPPRSSAHARGEAERPVIERIRPKEERVLERPNVWPYVKKERSDSPQATEPKAVLPVVKQERPDFPVAPEPKAPPPVVKCEESQCPKVVPYTEQQPPLTAPLPCHPSYTLACGRCGFVAGRCGTCFDLIPAGSARWTNSQKQKPWARIGSLWCGCDD